MSFGALSADAMQLLFVLLVVLTVFSYAIYPVVVGVWAKLVHRGWNRTEATPSMTLVISVYNEEAVIREKLENALALDYPRDLLEILVVSDGSTDRTVAIAEEYGARGIRLLVAPERHGKTAALNLAVPGARGEIVAFTDANAMFPPTMLRTIARNFSDPDVGLVTGWTKYVARGGHESVGLYVYSRLERATKEAESLVSSCVGADGAVLAMRRALYRDLRHDDINDFVLPLDVV